MKTILQLKSTKLYSSRQFDLFVVRIYYLRRLPLKILHTHTITIEIEMHHCKHGQKS